MSSWEADQEWERGCWGDCLTTFGEENKQITYAHRMGLELIKDDYGNWPLYDLEGKSVLDIGGGPVSILLKTINGGTRALLDPCKYPEWVLTRYSAAGVYQFREAAEGYTVFSDFDEVWIYNVLQHVQDPEAVIETAWRHADVIRLFEWIDQPPTIGHPHELKAEALDSWLGGRGTIEQMNENGCCGPAYYGVFKR
jgi:hypothetical protein